MDDTVTRLQSDGYRRCRAFADVMTNAAQVPKRDICGLAAGSFRTCELRDHVELLGLLGDVVRCGLNGSALETLNAIAATHPAGGVRNEALPIDNSNTAATQRLPAAATRTTTAAAAAAASTPLSSHTLTTRANH